MKEVEKDNFEGVLSKAAAVHPECTLCLLVDKLETWLTQQDRKGWRENFLANESNAGSFRQDTAPVDY